MLLFKQKTSYEMRISDRSSDGRSSDLACRGDRHFAHVADAGPCEHNLGLERKGLVRAEMFLADERGRVAGAAKQRGQRLDSVEERLVMDVVLQAVHAVLMAVETGVDHCPARAARRHRGETGGETRALSGYGRKSGV